MKLICGKISNNIVNFLGFEYVYFLKETHKMLFLLY